MLADRLCTKSTSKKKIQTKAWYRVLGTDLLSSTAKPRKSQRKTNYTHQNENSLDSLASNLSYN